MDSIHSESGQYELSSTESVYTSSSSVLLPTTPRPQPYEQRRAFRIGSWEFSLFWSNILFAVIMTAGNFGQDVTLPLWLHSIDERNSSALNARVNSSTPTVDSYFAMSFTSLSLVMIFGVCLLFIRVFSPRALGDNERRFSHLLLFLVGLCDALYEVLTAFSSKMVRTPLYLQVILGNFLIPSTILFRRLILRKKPTRKKMICAVIVAVAPVICLITKFMPSLDSKHKTEQPKADVVSTVLWPLIFTIKSLVLAPISNAFTERGLKMQNEMSRRGVNLVYFLFWTNVYKFLCIAALFWVDILPWYGDTPDGINDFGSNWWFGIRCFFGAAGCDATSGIRGTMFILMSALTYFGGANLLRHAEGATWLAVVLTLITPLEFIFWSFFSATPFKWQPDDHWDIITLCATGAILVMLPAALTYNKGAPEISLDDVKSRRRRK